MHRRGLREKKRREDAEAAVATDHEDVEGKGSQGGPSEIVLAIVLAVSGLLTSWAGYQATLWSGEQDLSYNQSNSLRIEASRASARADMLRSVDVELFSAWLNAVASDEALLQEFYRKRFRLEFAAAFETWIALRPIENPDAPASPFIMPEYRSAEEEAAQALEARADAALADARRDDNTADTYVQVTVILATAMFLAGVCQVFRRPRVRLALTTLCIVTCALGVARLIGLPVLAL